MAVPADGAAALGRCAAAALQQRPQLRGARPRAAVAPRGALRLRRGVRAPRPCDAGSLFVWSPGTAFEVIGM